jgi:hypothetical protein
MRTKVSVAIAVALTLGSTSAVLAQGNGDGGPFDAGGFHESGFGGEDHHGADFNRNAYRRGSFQGDAINVNKKLFRHGTVHPY